MVSTLEPAFVVPSQKQVMHDMYDQVKAHLLAELDGVEYVASTARLLDIMSCRLLPWVACSICKPALHLADKESQGAPHSFQRGL